MQYVIIIHPNESVEAIIKRSSHVFVHN